MFANFIYIFICLMGMAGSIISLSYFISKYQRKLAEQIKQKTLNDLTIKGLIKRQGEVGLVIQHVYNSEIVDTFIEKFNEAFTETAHCMEFHNDEVKLWFKIADVKMAKKIKDDLEKAGFYIGNFWEGKEMNSR